MNDSMQRAQGRRLINVSFEPAILDDLDRLAKKSKRSAFINEAVKFYIRLQKRQTLRESVKKGVIANRDLNREIHTEWESLEDEVWGRLEI